MGSIAAVASAVILRGPRRERGDQEDRLVRSIVTVTRSPSREISWEPIFFGSGNKDSLLLTAANNSQALGATDPGSFKLTPLSAFPSKGRGSMGVRCQRLLKGEDQLYFAGLVSAEPVVLDSSGQALEVPEIEPKRDASGSTASGYVQGAC